MPSITESYLSGKAVSTDWKILRSNPCQSPPKVIVQVHPSHMHPLILWNSLHWFENLHRKPSEFPMTPMVLFRQFSRIQWVNQSTGFTSTRFPWRHGKSPSPSQSKGSSGLKRRLRLPAAEVPDQTQGIRDSFNIYYIYIHSMDWFWDKENEKSWLVITKK